MHSNRMNTPAMASPLLRVRSASPHKPVRKVLVRVTTSSHQRHRRTHSLACFALWVCTLSGGAFAQRPEGYPADYGAIISAARDEGKVVVYSTTDLSAVAALI